MLEIEKLHQMLTAANIPHTMNRSHLKIPNPSYQIVVYNKCNAYLCDAIFGTYSYGYKNGLLEIMGGLTEEEEKCDSVLGGLTAEEVFERFKYCYENNTSVYVAHVNS